MYDALCAYRCAFKVTTKFTPFQLIYGLEAILPIELEVQSLRIALDEKMDDDDFLKHRLVILEKMDEIQAQAHLNMEAIQKYRKSYYNSKLASKKLEPNDLVLLYDNIFQRFLEKFKMRWFGPYRILRSFPNGSVELQDFAGKIHLTRYNGYRLKSYLT